MTENEIAKIVFDSSLKVHQALGPGLLESAYCECLCYELYKSGLFIEKKSPCHWFIRRLKWIWVTELIIIIENKFIIEVKAVDDLRDIHMAQLLTYLKLSNCKLGMLINFNSLLIKDGIKRVINGTL